MKIINEELLENEEYKQQALREALLLKNLDHPNVIKVHDFFKTPFGLFCIVMDFSEGFSL